MPYLSYNLPIHRTGWRPYGMTDTWAATQLSGLGSRRVFTEYGGVHLPLGQFQRGFSPRLLEGMGQAPAVCLDQNQNTIPCTDPNCTFGDCGSTGPQVTVGALCLDQHENQISCADANCTYGDCSAAKGLAPGPSPRVPVPVTQFPSTSIPAAPPTATTYPYGAPYGTQPSLWTQLTQSQLIPGLPNVVLFVGVMMMMTLKGGGGRRR